MIRLVPSFQKCVQNVFAQMEIASSFQDDSNFVQLAFSCCGSGAFSAQRLARSKFVEASSRTLVAPMFSSVFGKFQRFGVTFVDISFNSFALLIANSA